jgi:hypothetical protein
MSGHPNFIHSDWYKPLLGIISGYLVMKNFQHLSKQIRHVLVVFIVVNFLAFFFQYSFFGWNTWIGIFGLTSKILFGILIISQIGEKSGKIFFNSIFIICFISIPLMVLKWVGYPTPNLFPVPIESNFSSIIIFVHSMESIRNNGIFWEPGAFAGYIIMIWLIKGNIISIKHFRVKTVVIGLALLSTMSTTGYLVAAIILSKEIFASKISGIIKLSLFATIFGLFFVVYKELEFLDNKIKNQIEHTENIAGDYDKGRFGALIFDLHYIKKHPLFGNGLHERTRYIDHRWAASIGGHGNGMSNYIVRMGLVSFVIFFYFLLTNKKNSSRIFLGVILLLLLNSEQYFDYPFIFGLMIISTTNIIVKKENI